MSMRNTIAIIPARKGSVGLPGKNHKKMDGQPLIEYTIIEALKSELINEVIVSTDCPEIIKICEKFEGMLNVLIRPSDLARNDSKSEDVVEHACAFYLKTHSSIGSIILLQPTSPIRTAKQIDDSLRLFESSGKLSLVSVTEAIQHPYDFVIEKDGNADYLCRDKDLFMRQNFAKSWFMNGAIYISDYKLFTNKRKIYDLKNCVLYKMPIESSIDIDTEFDFEICEYIVRRIKEKL